MQDATKARHEHKLQLWQRTGHEDNLGERQRSGAVPSPCSPENKISGLYMKPHSALSSDRISALGYSLLFAAAIVWTVLLQLTINCHSKWRDEDPPVAPRGTACSSTLLSSTPAQAASVSASPCQMPPDCSASSACRCYNLWGGKLCSSKQSAAPSETFTGKWERHTWYPFWDLHWEYGLTFTTLTQGCRHTKQKLEVCFIGPQNTKVKTSATSFSSSTEEKSRLFRWNSEIIYEQATEEIL